MLKTWIRMEKPDDKELKIRLHALQAKLSVQQIQLKEHKLPVIILLEGWSAAGKGRMLSSIISNIDPRFFRVASIGSATEEECRYPFLHRYIRELPERGEFTFFDSGWGSELVDLKVRGKLTKAQYASRVNSIKRFERQLMDNGYLVLKFFLHVSQKEQKKRLDRLERSKDTAWRVNAEDKWQNRHYSAYLNAFDQYLSDTNMSVAPWHPVDAGDKKWASLQVLEMLCGGIETALQNESLSVPIPQNVFPLIKMPKLNEISLDQTLDGEKYRKRLDTLQKKLNTLHYRLYRKKVPVIIVYEGWDAAGKGGNIRRIAEALDPRGYEVIPTAAPEPGEKARHFLWRFWMHLPKTGHIAIFDRSWYGRVMVERLEGFCSANDWQRAYNEINEFEKELSDWGAVIIKFWVQIDKETQLARFEERENTPEKQWKITEEDWRNREKWDAYEGAVDEMLQKTSTTYAPWHILESVDKHYARIKALEIVTEKIEKALT